MALFAAVALVMAGEVRAADEEGEYGDEAGYTSPGNSGPRLQLARFRVAQFTLLQSGGDSFSGIASWNPSYGLTDRISLGAYAGFSLAAAEGGTTFPIVDYGAYGRYGLSPRIELELQLGLQSWVEDSGSSTHFRVGAVGAYVLEKPLWGFVDHVFAGYGTLLIETRTTHDLRAGVGLRF